MFIPLNFSYVVQCVIAPDISPRNRGVRVPAGTQMDSANRCLAKPSVAVCIFLLQYATVLLDKAVASRRGRMLFELGARSTTPTLKEPVGVQLKLVVVAATATKG